MGESEIGDRRDYTISTEKIEPGEIPSLKEGRLSRSFWKVVGPGTGIRETEGDD